MSDADLRECEHALAQAPDDLALLRQHARLSRRHGLPDRALASLDLAWRLGAEDVEEQLLAELDARSFSYRRIEFRYVPAGAFVMGLDTFDADASPAHLVRLSAFYVSKTPVLNASLLGSGLLYPYWEEQLQANPSSDYAVRHHVANRERALRVTGVFQDGSAKGAAQGTDLPGRYDLPSEAQWERAFRASLLRPDGTSIYGLERAETVEWIADTYVANAYDTQPRFDPRMPDTAEPEAQYVIRGVPDLPDELYPLYREAATAAGAFKVGRLSKRNVRIEAGIAFRMAFVPT